MTSIIQRCVRSKWWWKAEFLSHWWSLDVAERWSEFLETKTFPLIFLAFFLLTLSRCDLLLGAVQSLRKKIRPTQRKLHGPDIALGGTPLNTFNTEPSLGRVSTRIHNAPVLASWHAFEKPFPRKPQQSFTRERQKSTPLPPSIHYFGVNLQS